MNKRKIALLAMSACMIAILAIGGTLAYFTDTDEKANVFTMGNVKIDQIEQERVKDQDDKKTDKLDTFTQDQIVFPGVYDTDNDPARTPLKVGDYTITYGGGIRNFPNYIDKIVTVKNTGNVDAYVRTIIAVPHGNDDPSDGNVSQNWLHANMISDTDTNPSCGWYFGTPENKLEYPAYGQQYYMDNVKIGEKYYDVTVATNVNILPDGETTGPCMAGFYLDNDLNYEADGEGEDGYYVEWADGHRDYVWTVEDGAIKILVATQAVQAEGFADAWEAFAQSFGEIEADDCETLFANIM